LGVETLTFKIDLVCEETGIKETQSYREETVPDLKIKFYKLPNPTIFPAYTYYTPYGY
jgi:hypothetical protein